MPHIRFNWVDILFITLLIRIGYIAFKNGFLPEFFRTLGLLSAFIVSFNNYTILSSFISTHTKWTGAEPDIISFLFIFLLTLFIFKILAIATHSLLGCENISGLNKLVGLAISCGRALLLIGLIYTLFVNSPFEYLHRSVKEKSFAGRYVSGIAPAAYSICINLYPGKKNETPLVKLLQKD
jgi:uncharacterized membrane protein required for colicin V production